MRRIVRAAAWLCLIALIALGPFWAASSAVNREELVRKKYESWTGVLRLWKCEGWESGNGTLTAWLGECVAAFEKRHPGAYIQMTDVSEETLRSFADGSINPPDMILYAPGMLEAPYSLLPIDGQTAVRKALDAAGYWQGTRYAVPVALGGYGLAINSRLLPETPSDWSVLEEKKGSSILNAPADGKARSWSAALIALFAGSSVKSAEKNAPPVGEGIDLGLTTEKPAETERPEAVETTPNALPAHLPEDFRTQASVYSQFTGGRTAAIPVTQREIRRLQLLSGSGKAPDWRMECIGLPFTDQAAMFSVVAWPREDAQARQALALEFLNLMLSEERQRKLTNVRAFSVLDTAPMYQADPGMRELEKALSDSGLLVPNAFGKEWRAYASELMDQIGTGEGTQGAWSLLEAMISGR